jgi:hypothetical protein
MKIFAAALCIIFPFAIVTGACRAQQPLQSVDKPLLEEFKKWAASNAPGAVVTTTPTEAIDSLRQAEADYDIFVFKNRRQNLEWQLSSSKWIFAMVMIIVSSGLLLAIVQFVITPLRRPETGSKEGAKNEKFTLPTTTFEASLSGIKVGSPVLGVIILAMSMVFFYLYVIKIYPITELEHAGSSAASQERTK